MLQMRWLLLVRSGGKIRMVMKLRIELLIQGGEGNLNTPWMPEDGFNMLQVFGTSTVGDLQSFFCCC